jgi:hypothetical protein
MQLIELKNTLFLGVTTYRGADKSLAHLLPDVFCLMVRIFRLMLVFYIYSTNIPPIMIINMIYETQNLLSLYFVSFLVGLRNSQHPCISGTTYTVVSQNNNLSSKDLR